MGRLSWVVVGLAVIVCFATFATVGITASASSSAVVSKSPERLGGYHAPLVRAPAGSTAGQFAFVSNFEDGALDGWVSLAGSAPSVTTKTTYFGEPALKSSAGGGAQISAASQDFITGGDFVSFQVALNAAKGAGFFGIADAGHSYVAVVGISDSEVWAGSSLTTLTDVGPLPTGTVYPSGWAYLSANVHDVGSKTPDWVMDLFVDRSDVRAGRLSVPTAGTYAEALLETTAGTAYYSNIVVTTYEIPILVPGYNSMEGYGQGSGLLVQLLPAYTKLTAEMTLNTWDTPQVGILSFQINALNLYGTTRSTCGGFFQLGIDLDPQGTISPWYVPGKNCIAHFFLNSRNPAIQPGVASPAGTHLTLTIEADVETNTVTMTIVDTTINQVFTTSFAYGGGPFYGMYTQLEWQPCCSSFPIEDYQFSGTLYNERITTLAGTVQGLGSDYMLPFTLDAPTTWSLTYYQDSILGYDQLA